MRMKILSAPVAMIVVTLFHCGPGFAQALDGQYKAVLNCDKLPFTKAPLTNEPVTLTISHGKASYLRTLYGYDRNTVVGKETGAGVIAADGTIILTGGWRGLRDSLTASYQGRLVNGSGTLAGKHVMTYKGQTYDRACSLTVAK